MRVFQPVFSSLTPCKNILEGVGTMMSHYDILTSINVVKMSCIPRVSEQSHDIYHGGGIPWQWLYQKTSFFNDGHSKVAVYSDANILVQAYLLNQGAILFWRKNVDFLFFFMSEYANLEACLKKLKKVFMTFYLTILPFFLTMRNINSQF